MDSYNITVSVIIPVYNNDNTITRCVDSCIKQSYLPSEIYLKFVSYVFQYSAFLEL